MLIGTIPFASIREIRQLVNPNTSSFYSIGKLVKLIFSAGDTLGVEYTDVQSILQFTVPAEFKPKKEVTFVYVDVSTLLGIFGRVSHDIEVDVNTHDMILKSGGAEWKLLRHIADVLEYPSTDYIYTWEMNAKLLDKILCLVSLAHDKQDVGKEDNKNVLSGIHLRISDTRVMWETTDRKRVAQYLTSLPVGLKDDIIIPDITEVYKKIFANVYDDVSILVNKQIFAVKNENILYTVIQYGGKFPEVDAAIPNVRDASFSVKINKVEFKEVLDQAAVIKVDPEHIKLRFTNNKVEFSAISDDGERFSRVLDVDAEIKTPVELGFSSKYLMNGIKFFTGDEVVLYIFNENKPAVFQQSNDIKYLLMPIKKK